MPEFLVACLCAEWCGTCRDYRAGFESMTKDFPNAEFLWLDIEEQGDLLDDLDVENFPTLLIQRNDDVMFFGIMLPQHHHLRRLLETFHDQSAEESRLYAHKTAERQGWQTFNLRRLLGR